MNSSDSSETVTFKKRHVQLFLLATILCLSYAFLATSGNESVQESGENNSTPIPNSTKIVPVTSRTVIYDSSYETQNQLDEIREQNCELSQELLLQSLDISRQADELDWASDGLSDFDRIQELRNQAMRLMMQSQELSDDC